MPSSSDLAVDAWLADLMSSTSDYAIIVIDPQGSVMAWRGAAERLFGYSEAEALGMPFSQIFTEQDRQRGLDEHEIALALATGRSEDDRWHVRKGGGSFWASGILHAVRQPDGSVPALCKVVRDRTDVRAQLDTLQNQLHACAREATRRNELVTALAHELRNPMAPIQSALEVLAAQARPEIKEQAMDVLARQVRLLKALLDDLNDATSVVVGQPRISTQRLSVHEALHMAADSMRANSEARQQQLQLTLPAATIWIAADPTRLQQMLLNLLDNAIKYTPPGGQVNLSATVEAATAVIRVEDDGMGISAEILPTIFELFTREERDPSVPGLGVGLAVVKQLASLHGGTVEARSPGAGKGSIFRLRLPLQLP